MNTISAQSLMRVALDAAARGWHVFPLRHNDKRPAFPDHNADTCTGADPRCRAAGAHVDWEARAATDPGRIRRAWTRYAYNVGIACGPSGLVVVDLDKPKPGEVRPEAWHIDGVSDGADVLCVVANRAGAVIEWDTYTARTGRGGTHLYYRHPDTRPQLRNTNGDRGNGLGWLVDTRAHGGYVVAAGSVAEGRPYTVDRDAEPAPLPGWLAERLTPQPLPPQQPVVVELGTGRRAAYLDAAITRSLDAIGQAREGTLNTTLYGAAVALGQLVAGGELDAAETEALLVDAAVRAKHPIAGARRTVRSGFRAGARRPRSVAA